VTDCLIVYMCVTGALLAALAVLLIWNPRHKTADDLWDDMG